MPQPVPIIVYGAGGRMGQMILQLAAADPAAFRIVAGVDHEGNPLIGKPIDSVVQNAPAGLKFETDLPDAAEPGTVVIDFSLPEASLRQMQWAAGVGAACVIGTTGFSDEQKRQADELAKKIPLILAPNMSVGVNVLYELVRSAVRMLGEEYDIEISEMHHRFKKDAPSGTAKALLNVVLESRGKDAPVAHGREGITGERDRREIGMHCLRGGDVVGDHTVTFAALGERVELTHKASSRETFARGALRAAKWLSGREPGVYSIKDVLGL